MQKQVEQTSLKLPPIVEQYYEFCVWLLPKVSKFKKDQKYILGTRLQNKALDSLELIISAALSSKIEKIPYLKQAILKLEHTRFYLRLAVQIKMINPKSYAYGSKKIIETSGKLGAWRKSVATDN